MNLMRGNTNMKNKKLEETKKESVPESTEQMGSPFLDRYIQKSMTDHMQEVDARLLAEAIKTLLHQDNEKTKHLN